MKYMAWSLMLLLLIGESLSAQSYTAIKAGVGFANLRFKNAGDPYQGRTTWYGGFMVHNDFNNQFFFQPEFLFSLRGYHEPATATTNSANIAFGYLSIPLLAGYKPLNNLSIMIGPEPGYMLFAKS